MIFNTGCRYCASAEPEFHMLINHFLKEDVEFYHVDVGEVEMPYQLEVSWTPYVRYVVNLAQVNILFNKNLFWI